MALEALNCVNLFGKEIVSFFNVLSSLVRVLIKVCRSCITRRRSVMRHACSHRCKVGTQSARLLIKLLPNAVVRGSKRLKLSVLSAGSNSFGSRKSFYNRKKPIKSCLKKNASRQLSSPKSNRSRPPKRKSKWNREWFLRKRRKRSRTSNQYRAKKKSKLSKYKCSQVDQFSSSRM